VTRAFAAPVLAIAALTALPLVVTSNTWLNVMVFALIVALAAQGWNILGGYGGQFSFGHAAFFGTGAYAMLLLQLRLGLNAWPALAAAIGLGALAGLLVGALVVRARLRGSYFALVTLAVAEVLRISANAAGFTGGAAGALLPLDERLASLQFASRAQFYWFALVFVGAVLLLTRAIERSRFGAELVAVRENEAAASALGVDAFGVKLKAITLSGGITAAAGALYTQKFLYLDANLAYGPWISVEALLAPIIGGAGTAFGPIIGAAALIGLGEATKGIAGQIPGVDLVVFGALLVLTVAFAPRGLIGLAKSLRR
jgi:branched-chain amino acid transport system permease protein